MKIESTPFKTLLLIAIVLAIVAAPASVNYATVSMSPQEKGGGIKPLPTPTPKKTTPPKKTSTPAKTNRAGATNTVRKTEPEAATTSAAEIAFWETIKTSTNPEDFREYLKKYPAGEFAGLARNRLNVLETAAKEDAARKEETKRKEEEAAKKRPGAVVKNSIGLELVWVPPGSFLMGTTAEGAHGSQPIHQVTFREGFYMGKFEVTQGQWKKVMGKDPFNYIGENHPVELVSWNDTQEFIRKLNETNDGYLYRLPTESEWEYACRAGTTTDFAFGNTLSWEQANFVGDMREGTPPARKNPERVAPVGSFAPNAFGLYDMHGNVMEWCEDWYHKDYNGAPTDGSAWLSGGEQKERVQRGGSLNYNWAGLRSAQRNMAVPSHQGFGNGFRLVAVIRNQ
jgi:formylglycine-generating enzyme required for sulfatase activity